MCSNVAKFNFKALILQSMRACVGILTNLDNLDFDTRRLGELVVAHAGGDYIYPYVAFLNLQILGTVWILRVP